MNAAMPTWWRQPAELTEEECREAVQDALDSLPSEIASKLDNVAVIVEDGDPSSGLLGLFDPRGSLQRIIIYRQLHSSSDQVKRTVLHEVGHYFGMNEQQIRELGYG